MKLLYHDHNMAFGEGFAPLEQEWLQLAREIRKRDPQGSFETITEAWLYCPSIKRFDIHQNSTTSRYLKIILEEKGIEIRPSSASIKTGNSLSYRFVSSKDEFLFKLAFGL